MFRNISAKMIKKSILKSILNPWYYNNNKNNYNTIITIKTLNNRPTMDN